MSGRPFPVISRVIALIERELGVPVPESKTEAERLAFARGMAHMHELILRDLENDTHKVLP